MKQEVNVLLTQPLAWAKHMWGCVSCALNWLDFQASQFLLERTTDRELRLLSRGYLTDFLKMNVLSLLLQRKLLTIL